MFTRNLYDFARSQILPLAQIDDLTPKSGKIVDLGCGQGVIAKYLAEVKTREVIGVDNNQKRLATARQKNLSFTLADIRDYDLKGAKAVIISDVLHHLSLKDQYKLLTKIAKSLEKGAVLIIKDVDTQEFVRSRLTRLWDLILYPSDKIHFHKAFELKAYLESLGFKVKITRPLRLFPGSTTLLFCQK